MIHSNCCKIHGIYSLYGRLSMENHPRHGYSPVKDSSFIYFLKTCVYPDNYRYSYNLDTCKPSLLITHWINGQTRKTEINNYYFYFDCNKYNWIINCIKVLRQQIRLDYKFNQKLKFLQSDKTCLIEEIQLKQKKVIDCKDSTKRNKMAEILTDFEI